MLNIYTDGAVSKNGSDDAYGGWCYICENNHILECGYVKPATNQICELMGVLNACKNAKRWISLNTFPLEEVSIFTDSAYIVNCYEQQWWKTWIINGWKNSKKQPVANQELWEQLIPFFTNPRFHFIKVKGHMGNCYNEIADTWAVKAKVNRMSAIGYYSLQTKTLMDYEESEDKINEQ